MFGALWQGAPYPVAEPAATAREPDGHTQAVYGTLALALPDAELADRPGAGLVAEGADCNLRGMRHWSENGLGVPPQAPQVVDVSAGWALEGVPLPRVAPAVDRVRADLTRRGWKVTEYQNTPRRLQLRLELPGTAPPSPCRRTRATVSRSPRTPTAPATRRARR
ncbi:hypothetical protein ACGFZK_20490 [Streptomyces sp. NPDC048257]|uniref:hypothetical protein n=1 Tax=Streptomyces sp. NPDC048257 TaxID=3365526 RepID=UPI0037219331